MKSYLKIHPKDNVAVALCPLSAGTVIGLEGRTFSLAEDIPRGHKFAVSRIPAAGQIIKYGAPVGTAGTDIPPGAWVHTHNMHTALGEQLAYTYTPQASGLPADEERFFQGYRRTDGKAAVRNELWIIPTVGCVNSIASRLEQLAQPLAAGTIDAVAAFPHPYGCSQMGEDQENTRKILADLILHPNARRRTCSRAWM